MFVFVTGFKSPHVTPLLQEISKHLEEKVIIIECIEITGERKKMGYHQNTSFDQFEIISLLNERDRCMDLINNADVVDYGWHLVDLLKERVRRNKLTFLENERLLKKGLIKFLDPRLWDQIFFNISVRKKNVYFLSTGDYAANDYRILGFKKDKILRFGYFPKTYYYENVFKDKVDAGPLKCLWVGRFIGWKKAIDSLKALREIPKHKIKMKIIGDGMMREKIENYIVKYDLGNVELTGMLQLNEVRDHMLQADVLISTSTREEGWGAVINEAMNSGCAIVSSDGSGAVPNLIKDGYNGLVYRSGCIEQLTEKLTMLSNDKHLARILGSNAYNTITKLWNEQVAARRLMDWIVEQKWDGEKIFKEGPCSKVFAEIN